MPIRGLSVRGLPPLPPCDLECDEQVNLFIGPNSSGKSTVLRAIDVILSRTVYTQEEYEDTEEGILLNPSVPGVLLAVTHDWTVTNPNFHLARQLIVPFLYLPAARVNLPPLGTSPHTIDRTGAFGIYVHSQDESGVYNPHLYYGNEETSPIFLDPEQVDSKSVFYGNRVEQALANIRKNAFQYKGKEEQFLRAIRIGYSCARSICSEVIADEVPHPFFEVENSGDSSGSESTVHFDLGIVTTDNVLGEPFYAGALSSGTQGTLLWIWALALHIAYHYQFSTEWEKKPAILLIDEIENHLHPTWQRRVIPALLEHFPGLQIFATTHSPFVVAGLRAGQVHLLKRDENTGVVTASTEDIIGWTADEILRTMMDVDEPTDQLTVDRASRLRELRNQDTLTSEEESELNELRRQVNETFLNKSSPLEAQRERYADLMRRFLLSRQSDLSQDGG